MQLGQIYVLGDSCQPCPAWFIGSSMVHQHGSSGNQDSNNSSLAHPEETLDDETLYATSRSGHGGRGQAKELTELTCVVSQAECM